MALERTQNHEVLTSGDIGEDAVDGQRPIRCTLGCLRNAEIVEPRSVKAAPMFDFKQFLLRL